MTSSPSTSPTSSPVYCLCSHKLRATGWNSQFARLIHELDESHLRLSQLKQIEKFIRFDTFLCRSKESELNAAQAMLTLWAKLLNFTTRWWQQHVTSSPSTQPSQNTSPAPPLALPTFHPTPLNLAAPSPATSSPSSPRLKDLRLVFELIDHVINRHEFDLIHLIPPPPSPSPSLSMSSRMYRAQSMTVPRGDTRFAGGTEHRDRGYSDRLYGSGGRITGGDSNTVPTSPSNYHGARNPQPHPTWLNASEQLHLLQSYRQLLQHTVSIVLRMVRESSEGRCELQQLSSHSSTASFFSSTSSSTQSTATSDAPGEGWEAAGADAVREEDVSDLNDAIIMQEPPLHAHPHPALLDHCKVVEADAGYKTDVVALASTLGEGQKEAEREAVIEKMKVEQMKPELTVDVQHLSQAILNPLLPVRPLSPLSASSPLSPLSPSASTASPPSSARSFSSLAASTTSSLATGGVSLLTRPDFVWFAGRLLAIVFFRLPVLSGILLDSLSSEPIMDRSAKLEPVNERKPSIDGGWRESLRAQVDDWARRQSAAVNGVKKSASISTLSNLLSLTSAPSLATTTLDDSDTALTRSATLPLVHVLPPPPLPNPSPTRSQRSLTSAFLHANPSFFEWTKPELNRDTYTHTRDADRDDPSDPQVGDEELERANDASTSSDHEAPDDDASTARCIKLLLSHPSIFFTFAAGWMAHVHHTTNPIQSPQASPLPPFINAVKQEQQQSSTSSLYADAQSSDGIMWDLIPGYRLLLHTVLKRLILQPVQQEDDEEDETEIDPTEVPALTPLIDIDWLRRKEEKRDERLVVQLRKESSTECQTYILKNSDSRPTCLAWLTEVLLRHTAVTDKRGVEKTLESLDTWYTLFLTPETGVKKLPISVDSSFSSHSLPHSKLAHHLPAVLTPNVTLPWMSFTPATFLAQQRERCMRARHLQRHTVVNPSMSYPFPASYCTPLLIQALSILLHQEHFQVLLKTLTFIYMHTGHFLGEDRVQLFSILLSPALFPRLFLHWCAEIRRVFHCILVYRLLRDGRICGFVPGTVEEWQQRTVPVRIDGKEELIPVVEAPAFTLTRRYVHIVLLSHPHRLPSFTLSGRGSHARPLTPRLSLSTPS